MLILQVWLPGSSHKSLEACLSFPPSACVHSCWPSLLLLGLKALGGQRRRQDGWWGRWGGCPQMGALGSPLLSLGKVLNLRRRHGQWSERGPLWKNGGERGGPHAWLGPLMAQWDWSPSEETVGRRWGTRLTSSPTLVSKALRKPFPRPQKAADPPVWNWAEVADGILPEGYLVLGMVGREQFGAAIEIDKKEPSREEAEVPFAPPKGAKSY